MHISYLFSAIYRGTITYLHLVGGRGLVWLISSGFHVRKETLSMDPIRFFFFFGGGGC